MAGQQRALAQLERAQRLTSSAEHLATGRELLAKGKAQAAEEAFSNAILLTPESPQPLIGRSLARLAKPGQSEEAILDAQKAVDLGPNLAPAWQALGRCHMAQKAYNKAKEAFSNALKHDPFGAEYYCDRCDAFLKLKEKSMALLDAHEAVRQDPKLGRGWNRLGECELEFNRLDSAIGFYSEALRQDPGNVAYLSDRGNALIQQGNLEAAGIDAEAALRADPSDALGWNLKGACLSHSGQLKAAREAFSKAIEIDQSHPLFLFNRAHTALALNHPDAALADATAALALVPNDSSYYALKAACLTCIGDDAAALEAFEKVFEKRPDPGSAELWTARGAVLFRLGRILEALKSAEAALERDTDNVQALTLKAEVELSLGRSAVAFQSFSEVLKREPGNSNVLTSRSQAAIANREFAVALEDAEAVLKIDVFNPEAWEVKCQALEGLGEIERAAMAREGRSRFVGINSFKSNKSTFGGL
eukprot:Protomagalhaensia_sp_Gyna_25__5656@NODE_79_length_5521_cov_51_014958_g60_i0_p2_GENE_NODE_79_length_5521_cov_51_014958_g60_i0NODE_79_length_5521_cov_51_014958_g60_i0_p2_ORF_typecomplete_len542_score128_43TPR_16/PF13432_6/1TPR_16/PF13432_6/0_077TPR_16/PF13432_6/7_6e09TPR_16/PF13432_6/6_7e07TPR_16/PF13432_6/4_4e14TPR_16/PF13432_6/1_3e05TPR_16/PF13432_6/5_7e05TPR_16/PF13432_6/1e08TPR_16/PF13432_6/0_0038TPR_15/PF13429_6/0_81TPR_15/PF13429_6/3_5e06TPR_15/PF13429_6/1_8e13TPR_15/PF13429_6/1_7e15TPR_15/P